MGERAPGVRVELAFLELMSPSLLELADRLNAEGLTQLRLVPVFLGGAGHVLRDLPGLMAQCATAFPALHMELAPSVGQEPEVIDAIARVALGKMVQCD
jgi:sirohydrochlorin cobaltochelatase